MALHHVISPIDGSTLVSRETASPTLIERVLAKAVAARAGWRATPLPDRIQFIEAYVKWFEANAQAIGVELSQQMGRPIRYTPNEILRGFQERARHMSSVAERALADVAVEPKEGFTRFIRRGPVGTVLVVAPWNYPYLTSVNTIVPALLAGNTVVLKHAQQTLLCGERYAEGWAAIGGPEGVFQNIVATHDDVAKIIADERIDFAAFTGSVEAGHAIQRAASGRFIGTGLELGGKDPSYVRRDADVAYAIAENVDGAFFNSGQSCCGIERIYVDASVYDEFVEGFLESTRGYVLGNPLDESTTIGPMVSAKAAASVRAQIDQAISRGARAVVRESDFDASRPGTPYLGPTVLLDVDHTMDVMTEESFGPVIGIMKVQSDSEALRLMNDSKYGLTASVWTSDLEAALALGDQISTGTVFMNRCDYLDPALAWTGVKDTGHGITLSELGFGALTRAKSFHLKHMA
jgi:acyl-CoA reductase-like NAD-dependent aldehyde dehydrogenase